MAADKRPPVVCLTGPTASGKTELALRLCDRLPCDIVSVDSAMVYRGMDVGTAKPDADTLARYPHRLVDIRDPAEPYSAADFCREARAAIKTITAAGRIPLLVGGTMLYFRALLDGLADLPRADAAWRARLAAEADTKGWPALHARLRAVDPETADRLHPRHSQRIQRALEVYHLTGRPLSALQTESGGTPLTDAYAVRAFALSVPRPVLHARIAERFRRMLETGLIEEARALYERGDLPPELPALRAVGYRQVRAWLAGEYGYNTMIDKGIAATRQLAKRQITWLRRWNGLYWLDADLSDVPPTPAPASRSGAPVGDGSPVDVILKVLTETP